MSSVAMPCQKRHPFLLPYSYPCPCIWLTCVFVFVFVQQAVDYFQRALRIQPENGEIWSALGRCYLMQDQLQKAYSAYQQALYFLPAPKVRAFPVV